MNQKQNTGCKLYDFQAASLERAKRQPRAQVYLPRRAIPRSCAREHCPVCQHLGFYNQHFLFLHLDLLIARHWNSTDKQIEIPAWMVAEQIITNTADELFIEAFLRAHQRGLINCDGGPA